MRPHPVARMYYQNFDEHITERYGATLVSWPLSGPIKCPSGINSRVELKLLINAFESGTTRFERLTPQ